MDEELKPAEGTEKTDTVQEPQYTEIQLKAIDQGWIPKDQFDGDPEEFIDAAEFVRRGELFKKIESQSKELKAVRKALEALGQHHSKVKEIEYERALKSLKESRRQALTDGEVERALALEDKIDEVKAEKERMVEEAAAAAQVEESEGIYNPLMQSWVERNQWYEDDDVMRAAADGLGFKLHKEGHSPEEVLALVEKKIRKEFAHKFTNTNPARNKPSAVEPSTRQGTTQKETFKLSPEEEKIMRKIVAVTPNYTEADYIKELKAIKSRLGA